MVPYRRARKGWSTAPRMRSSVSTRITCTGFGARRQSAGSIKAVRLQSLCKHRASSPLSMTLMQGDGSAAVQAAAVRVAHLVAFHHLPLLQRLHGEARLRVTLTR